ncbi:DUF563 domain-containing protein [Bradyrhizobium sp. SRL28]|uniref:glycosyltransferase 61 family protein n=1 Tax=Bradyrhizobium sp. SRL28 TaxID=2836178 RepID=UPI001BDEC3E7|nr:glycosyltransferase family 61 protein [Bradyrhizobium sp. SRL28]MBT1515626.1 DUF563 domain-containing protein [Bradyrhizobium sp. SRL28]
MLSKYSFLPVTARVRGKLGLAPRMKDIAADRTELYPANQSRTLPAIALPNEFGRVRGVEPNSTLALQRSYVEASYLPHGATIAYRIDDAILADHTLYSCGAYEIHRSGGGKRAVLTGSYDEFEEAQLCTYAPSSIYFGHWLRDAMAMELLAEQRGLVPLSYKKTPWVHEPGYRKLMGLPGATISYARIRRLWMIDDLGLNAGWVGRFHELRARVRRAAKPGGPTHVLLARGSSGTARELLNARVIADLLVGRGFAVIEPESLTPQEIVDALGSATVVVSVEGSAINHVHYAVPAKAGVLVIEPPDRFNAFHKILMDFNGVRFGYVVGDPADGGFSLEPERLLRSLDCLEAAVSQ